ncbi:MAG: FAD-dependent oxidoreductase [Thermoleophilia bacterium]
MSTDTGRARTLPAGYSTDIQVNTDVLIVGGGMAGSFAAIRAREQGAEVVLVDKGYVSRSGSTPYPRGFMVFDPERGHELDQWMNEAVAIGEYVNNRDWTEAVILGSKRIFDEVLGWGAGVKRDEDGRILSNHNVSGGIEAMQLKYGSLSGVLRREVLKRGVTIVDRVTVTDLIKEDGRVLGAVGVSGVEEAFYVFRAKATVLCTGGGSFKPYGFPISSTTGDGTAMAYRVGAAVAGKEFIDTHTSEAAVPAFVGYARMERPPGRMLGLELVNAEGGRIQRLGPLTIHPEFEAHAGRAPVTEGRAGLGADAHGTSPHGQEGPAGKEIVGNAGLGFGGVGEGVWPVDDTCATDVPGLFAAGESCGTHHLGAAYPGGGWGLPSAAVTGERAGRGAAAFAAEVGEGPAAPESMAELKRAACAPVVRLGGFSPDWVTQILRNTVGPYFVLGVKRDDRLRAALTNVEFYRDHLVPRLFARDPHELRKAYEVASMVLNAEMKLRAGLFRTESRGTHYREDYPFRDDPDWLCWVLLASERGRMVASKRPIPEKWWPDSTLPYEERYPLRFPGEPSGDGTSGSDTHREHGRRDA